MKKFLVAALFSAAGVGIGAGQALAVTLDTDDKRLSYIMGFQVAQQIKAEGVDLDMTAFTQAFDDVKADKEPRLSNEDIQATMQRVQEARMKEAQAQGAKNKAEGQKFLADNAKKKGVKTTDSGLQYKVLNAGKGKMPAGTDMVEVHYRGTLIDGTEFDSSYSRGEPTSFPVNGVIKGWTEALMMMKEGAKWELYIPAELAYGPRGAGAMIGPDATLVFEVELLKVMN
ncbi:FKBP-type peptidyl-prolyl cis-trans isomerase [Pseudomonadota bacterium]